MTPSATTEEQLQKELAWSNIKLEKVRALLELAETEGLILGVERVVKERAAMRAALEPFAHFARQYGRAPMRQMDDVIYAIHSGTEYEADLRRSHTVAALEALDNNQPPEV